MDIEVNGRRQAVADAWQDDRLLWVLREHLGLTGTKHGCGQGLCGACTVLVDGMPQRSCQLTVASVQGRAITTIEGLAGADGRLHPVQQAWIEARVPQCGYCQAGQILACVALLREHPRPTEAQTHDALAGHLCRCGTQVRVRAAVLRASGQAPGAPA